MRLSSLQKYILLECYNKKSRPLERDGLVDFYDKKKSPKPELRAKIISKSIESLIDKELMTGYGVRTPHKWFIKEISLTDKGKKTSRKILGEQLSFKFKKKR